MNNDNNGPGSQLPPGAGGGAFSPIRAEVDVRDCEIEGTIPDDLNGGFYATGPDPQYPLAPGNIPFDGEGHVRMFRIRNGRVDYRTRYAKTERFVAQYKARRPLMPMYRHPDLDEPLLIDLQVAVGGREPGDAARRRVRHLRGGVRCDRGPGATCRRARRTVQGRRVSLLVCPRRRALVGRRDVSGRCDFSSGFNDHVRFQ